MANERLGAKNAELLLHQYRAERKRLIFQLDLVRETIDRLKAISAKEVESKDDTKLKPSGRRAKMSPTVEGKRGPGRPRKVSNGKDVKSGSRKKRVRTGGYRLSAWDDMVIATITKEGMLPKETIVERAKTWAKTNAKKMTADQVEVKVTRVLQKLSGPRAILGTHHTGLRRGYHYGLKEWFFTSTGALRKQHLDKLVLDSKV